jgi:hypothetical protein
VRLVQTKRQSAEFRTEQTVRIVAAQVEKLRHCQPEVIVARTHAIDGAFHGIFRCPWHRNNVPATKRKSYVFDADSAVFSDGSNTSMGFPSRRRFITLK